MKYETANIKALINRSVMISCIMITVNIGKINLALIFWKIDLLFKKNVNNLTNYNAKMQECANDGLLGMFTVDS